MHKERMRKISKNRFTGGLSSSMPPNFGISHGKSSSQEALDKLDTYEEKIRHKLQRERDDRNSSRPVSGLHHKQPDAQEDKIRRKLQRDDRSSSMPISSSPTATDADDAFEERLRRKIEGGIGDESKQAARAAADSYEAKVRQKLGGVAGASTRPGHFSSSIKDDAAFEEPPRRSGKNRFTGGLSSSMPRNFDTSLEENSSLEALDKLETYEEKIRHKLQRERDDRNSSRPVSGLHHKQPDAQEDKIRRKLQRDDRSSSMPISSSPTVTDADDAFEERLRRKIEGGIITSGEESKQAARAAAFSYEVKVRQKLGGVAGASTRPGHFSSSIKDYATRPKHLTSLMPANIEELRQESGYKSKKKEKSKPKYSTFDGCTLEDRRSPTQTEDIQHIGQEDFLQASSISFDVIFADLYQFQEENNGSLDIPVPHSSFLQIMDNLATMGMEELLKKRWDYQFAGLKAFKREHGDLFIPATHPTLGQWVRLQREHYRRFKQRLPSTVMTKKRFGKLEGIGFDEFVSWEEAGCPRVPKQPIQVASSVDMSDSEGEKDSESSLTLDEKIQLKMILKNKTKPGYPRAPKQPIQVASSVDMRDSEGESDSESSLTLDEKIQLKMKLKNKAKLVARAMKAINSSKKQPSKEAVIDADLTPTVESTLVAESSSSPSEATEFIEKQVEKHIDKRIEGLKNQSCEPNDERDEKSNLQYQHKSFKLEEVLSQNVPNITGKPDFMANRDDMFVESWSQLDSVLENVTGEPDFMASSDDPFNGSWSQLDSVLASAAKHSVADLALY